MESGWNGWGGRKGNGGGMEVEWRWSGIEVELAGAAERGGNEVGFGGMQEGSVRLSRFGEVGFGWDRGGLGWI